MTATQKRVFINKITLSLSTLSAMIALGFLFWILGILMMKGIHALNWNIFIFEGSPPGYAESGLKHALVGQYRLRALNPSRHRRLYEHVPQWFRMKRRMRLCSLVRPPLTRCRHCRAFVLNRDAPKRVVLALRMTWPVIWHLNASKPWVAIENNAEEVKGLALMPVGRRPDRRK